MSNIGILVEDYAYGLSPVNYCFWNFITLFPNSDDIEIAFFRGPEGGIVIALIPVVPYSLALLKKVFSWAREVNPSQPLTVGFWKGNPDHWGMPDSLPAIDKFVAENSDVISFHAYDGDTAEVRQKIASLKSYGRPLLCTEYLARGVGNTFETILPIFRENNIAAINWGFVSGKTNTIYPWSSWSTEFTDEPEIWHHDILRPDGTPYSESEISFLKSMMDN